MKAGGSLTLVTVIVTEMSSSTAVSVAPWAFFRSRNIHRHRVDSRGLIVQHGFGPQLPVDASISKTWAPALSSE